MGKKKETEEPTYAGNEDEVEPEGGVPEEGGFKFETDFNVGEEYKIAPVVPNGVYEGYITGVHFDASDCALVWDLSLKADDDIFMSDNETPVSGVTMQYKNWFPREGDDQKRTKTGKMTKRQAKINMLADFQKKMRINMNTKEAIMEGVQNAEWIGIEVIVTVEVRSYEGRISNQIKEMVAA